MPVKRSRIGKSMSFVEVDRLDCVSSRIDSPRELRPVLPSAAEESRKCLKPSTPENNRPSVMTVKSQESTYDALGGFLECCYYCKRKIRQEDEVFMYSDLRAFCTAMCRDTQMAFDKEMEKQCAKSEVVPQGQQILPAGIADSLIVSRRERFLKLIDVQLAALERNMNYLEVGHIGGCLSSLETAGADFTYQLALLQLQPGFNDLVSPINPMLSN